MSGRASALVRAVAVLAAVTLAVPRVAQPADYHRLADTRACGPIPNCWNVVSNAAFLPPAIAGLASVGLTWGRSRGRSTRVPYMILFAGTALTAVGSAYYHWAPNNERLVWDRLPIALSRMALTTALIGERVSDVAARRLIWPLLAFACASVLWWRWTEGRGVGDLRFYALVQFGSLVVIALIVVLYREAGAWHWVTAALALYAAAKVFEMADARLVTATGGLAAGHALKHLLAAAGVACIAAHHRQLAGTP